MTDLAWSIKYLLYGVKNTEKMIFVVVYFQALTMARFSFLVLLFHPNSEITENLFTVREYFAKVKFCAPTGLGTKWAIHSVGFNWFILPTWGG